MRCMITKVVLISLSIVLLAAFNSCGGGGGGGSVTITVTPATATVAKGATQQFVASDGASDITSSVTWSATSGTISTTGLYTPPTTLPADNVITVTATLGSDSGTAAVTLTVGSTISFTDKSFYHPEGVVDLGFLNNTQAVLYDEANHIIYTAFTYGNLANPSNYVYKSSDAGATFEAPAGNLTSTGCTLLVWPQMVIDSAGTMNVANSCMDHPPSIRGMQSQDAAVSFSPTTVASVDEDFDATLAADDNNNIYLVHESKRPAQNQVELNLQMKAADAAEYTLIGEVDRYSIAADSDAIDQASTAFDPDGNLLMVYSKKNDADNYRGIYFTKYVPSTGEVSEPMLLGGGDSMPVNPVIVMDSSGAIHVLVGVFDGGGSFPATSSYAIVYTKSTDDGVSWSSPAIIAWTQDFTASDGRYVTKYRLAATVDGLGNIVLAYEDVDGIYFMRSTDGGASWSAAQNIVSGITIKIEITRAPSIISMTSDSAGRVYIMTSVSETGDIPFTQYFGIGE